MQEDLFGMTVTDVKWPVPWAADATRLSGLTCWVCCKHCESDLLKKAGKVYRLCSRVGCKCFPASEICEWSNLFDEYIAPKPQAPGWDDF
jgi:hypothetical protein